MNRKQALKVAIVDMKKEVKHLRVEMQFKGRFRGGEPARLRARRVRRLLCQAMSVLDELNAAKVRR